MATLIWRAKALKFYKQHTAPAPTYISINKWEKGVISKLGHLFLFKAQLVLQIYDDGGGAQIAMLRKSLLKREEGGRGKSENKMTQKFDLFNDSVLSLVGVHLQYQ